MLLPEVSGFLLMDDTDPYANVGGEKNGAPVQPQLFSHKKVLWIRAALEWHSHLNGLLTHQLSSRPVCMTTESSPGPDIWSRLLIFTDQSARGQGMSDTHSR